MRGKNVQIPGTEISLIQIYRRNLVEANFNKFCFNELTYLASSCNRVFISQMGLVAVIAVKPKQTCLK